MTSDILAAMKPLPFPCYSWPLPDEVSSWMNMASWVRVTHAMSLRGETCDKEDVRIAAEACRQVNRFHPDIPATLAVNWSPYQDATYDPTEWGTDTLEDIFAYRDKLRRIGEWAGDVAVSAILLDHEKWKVRKTDDAGLEAMTDEWNTALNVKYDVFYRFAKRVFPDASVFLYMRGESGQHLTGNELGDGTSTRLYWPDDVRKTCGHINGHRDNQNMRAKYGPLISWWLACGWSRGHFENGHKLPVDIPLDNVRAIAAAIAENAPHEPVMLHPSPWGNELTDPWEFVAAFGEGAAS